MPKPAVLRCCASCRWIFKMQDGNPECPMCQFGSYSAYYVFGNQAYRYAKNQKPWKDEKLFQYSIKLNQIINENKPEEDLLAL